MFKPALGEMIGYDLRICFEFGASNTNFRNDSFEYEGPKDPHWKKNMELEVISSFKHIMTLLGCPRRIVKASHMGFKFSLLYNIYLNMRYIGVITHWS